MKAIRKRLTAVLSAALLATAFVAGFPGVASASCSQASVTLYSDQHFAGNKLTICYGSNVSNLADYGYPGGGNWSDKTSSVRFNESGTNTKGCLYHYAGYVSKFWTGTNNGDTGDWNWWNTENDAATSVKFDC